MPREGGEQGLEIFIVRNLWPNNGAKCDHCHFLIRLFDPVTVREEKRRENRREAGHRELIFLAPNSQILLTSIVL